MQPVMTREEYLAQFQAITTQMFETTKRKNHDYSGDSPDPFANFTATERLGLCGTEAGVMTRMLDKFMRITSFIKKGVLQVKDESVEDTCQDLAVYAIMLLIYIRGKKKQVQAAASAQPEATRAAS